MPEMLKESSVVAVRALAAGIFRRVVGPGKQAHKGELLGEIIDPCEGSVLREVRAPADGLVFFACHDALMMQRRILFGVIKDFHAG